MHPPPFPEGRGRSAAGLNSPGEWGKRAHSPTFPEGSGQVRGGSGLPARVGQARGRSDLPGRAGGSDLSGRAGQARGGTELSGGTGQSRRGSGLPERVGQARGRGDAPGRAGPARGGSDLFARTGQVSGRAGLAGRAGQAGGHAAGQLRRDRPGADVPQEIPIFHEVVAGIGRARQEFLGAAAGGKPVAQGALPRQQGIQDLDGRLLQFAVVRIAAERFDRRRRGEGEGFEQPRRFRQKGGVDGQGVGRRAAEAVRPAVAAAHQAAAGAAARPAAADEFVKEQQGGGAVGERPQDAVVEAAFRFSGRCGGNCSRHGLAPLRLSAVPGAVPRRPAAAPPALSRPVLSRGIAPGARAPRMRLRPRPACRRGSQKSAFGRGAGSCLI